MAGYRWELQNFGECFGGWLQTNPPIQWRKPVHQWIERLRADVVQDAHRELAIEDEVWAGWYCEVPDAGNALAVCVVYYRTHKQFRIARCLVMETLPRYRA